MLDDRRELGVRLAGVQAVAQYLASLAHATFEPVPARGVRQRHHPQQQRDRGDGGHREHDAPDVRIVNDVVQQCVHREGQHLSGDDHQLVDGHHSASPVRWRHFCEVQRAGHRRRTYADAEDDAGGHHDLDAGRQRTPERAHQEDAGTQQQGALSAEPVGHPAAEQCAEGGAREEQRADHRRLAERTQVQIVFHVQQRPGDDSGVVTEQQATEGGDHGQLGQEASG